MSWSAQHDVAESFAKGLYRTFEGGSVVLAVDAPPAAIICAVPEDEDTHGEAEYIVDRRRLCGVRVVERLAQVPLSARPRAARPG